MDETTETNTALDTGMQLFESGSDMDTIRHSLEVHKFTAEEIEDAMNAIKIQWYANRRRRGLLNLIIGCALLVIGCVVAVILHENTTFFRVALYGPSLVGTVIVCWGLIDILGW